MSDLREGLREYVEELWRDGAEMAVRTCAIVCIENIARELERRFLAPQAMKEVAVLDDASLVRRILAPPPEPSPPDEDLAVEEQQQEPEGDNRRLIVFDGRRWHVRHVHIIEHNWERDWKVYHCDQPISSDHRTLADVPEVAALLAEIAEERDALARRIDYYEEKLGDLTL